MPKIIRLIWFVQYKKPCVVAHPTDDADVVIAACRAGGAMRDVCPDDSGGETYAQCGCATSANGHCMYCCRALAEHVQVFVVQLRDDVGPERWTEAALRRSTGKGLTT